MGQSKKTSSRSTVTPQECIRAITKAYNGVPWSELSRRFLAGAATAEEAERVADIYRPAERTLAPTPVQNRHRWMVVWGCSVIIAALSGDDTTKAIDNALGWRDQFIAGTEA